MPIAKFATRRCIAGTAPACRGSRWYGDRTQSRARQVLLLHPGRCGKSRSSGDRGPDGRCPAVIRKRIRSLRDMRPSLTRFQLVQRRHPSLSERPSPLRDAHSCRRVGISDLHPIRAPARPTHPTGLSKRDRPQSRQRDGLGDARPIEPLVSDDGPGARIRPPAGAFLC
jgi:hypothetical protein